MHRERGRAQAQAAPLNDELVVKMLDAAGSTLRDLRNKALLAVAYTTLCRRSELVALLCADLEIESDGFGTVAIRRSKTDQEGAGEVAPITPDAMRHVKRWIEAAGISDGPLFRGVLKGGRMAGALDAGDVARIFKAMAGKAGLTAEEDGADQRTLDARRRVAGHGPVRRRVARDHAGRPVDDAGDGRALHAAPDCPPQCRGADRRKAEEVLMRPSKFLPLVSRLCALRASNGRSRQPRNHQPLRARQAERQQRTLPHWALTHLG